MQDGINFFSQNQSLYSFGICTKFLSFCKIIFIFSCIFMGNFFMNNPISLIAKETKSIMMMILKMNSWINDHRRQYHQLTIEVPKVLKLQKPRMSNRTVSFSFELLNLWYGLPWVVIIIMYIVQWSYPWEAGSWEVWCWFARWAWLGTDSARPSTGRWNPKWCGAVWRWVEQIEKG